MAADAHITGTDALRAVARRVKASGNTQLRKDMLRGLRQAAKPLGQTVREAFRADLPQEGGLNEFVAGMKIAARNRTSGKNAGIRLVGTKSGHDMKAIDAGHIRHPTFGHKDRYVTQQIKPGVWTNTLKREAPKGREQIVTVLTEIAERLARG